jgi:hypothetical protein
VIAGVYGRAEKKEQKFKVMWVSYETQITTGLEQRSMNRPEEIALNQKIIRIALLTKFCGQT